MDIVNCHGLMMFGDSLVFELMQDCLDESGQDTGWGNKQSTLEEDETSC